MPLFSKDILTLPKEDELEISIFGPGYGESIVLHIPKVGWGIIDSCVQDFEDTPIVPPLEYLLNILAPSHPKLAFIILTHPHEDHCRGIDRIIKEYPGGIDRVCRYDGNGIRELRVYNANKDTKMRQAVSGLVYAFNAMKEAQNNGAQLKHLGEMTLVFDKTVDIESYGSTNIRMLALSPSAESKDKYAEMLFSKFSVDEGTPLLSMDDKDHNLISVALILTLGDLQVVFGSDVEVGTNNKTGWSGIVSNIDSPSLWAHLVKVSHHGSENAHNDLAWEKFCSKGDPIALITPFLKGSVVLPNNSDLKRIKTLSQKVGLTGYINMEEKLNKYYSRNVVRSIKNRLRSMKIIETPTKPGLIRVRYSLDGTITDRIAKPPARWY